MFKRFYLEPTDGRKSFYNKCYVEEFGHEATLYSYNTEIMKYNTVTGDIYKYPAYNSSATTKRHQNAFMKFYNIQL